MEQDRVLNLVHEVHELTETLKRTSDLHEAEMIRETLTTLWPAVQRDYETAEQLADSWRGLHTNMHLLMNQQLSLLLTQAAHRDQQRRASIPSTPPAPMPITTPTNIRALAGLLSNQHQIAALMKLDARREEDMIYLNQYVANTDTSARMRDVEGTFSVFGSIRHGQRDAYNIKWYKPAASKGSFWCSCPDHKFNSGKKNMVCKHICFLVCRVGKILDPAFFNGGKQLTDAQHQMLKDIVASSAALSQFPTPPRTGTGSVVSRPPSAASAEFRVCRKSLDAEDSCPICYDTMVDTACLNCPTCSNNIHEDCMKVWLENHDTCVFCRSTVWRRF